MEKWKIINLAQHVIAFKNQQLISGVSHAAAARAGLSAPIFFCENAKKSISAPIPHAVFLTCSSSLPVGLIIMIGFAILNKL